MRVLFETNWPSLVGMITTMLVCVARTPGVPTAPVVAGRDGQRAMTSEDANQLQWDLGDKFEFDWDSVELSSKVLKSGTSSTGACTLTISMRVRILDAKGLATIDVNRPEVIEVLDENGEAVRRVPEQLYPVRCYEENGWLWNSEGAYALRQWHPGAVVLRLPTDSNHAVPSSISRVTGCIHAIYGEVIKVDVPFDARGGDWLEFKDAPDLSFRVDSSTAPPPGPISRQRDTPIGLHRYETWVRSLSGKPVMSVRDPWPWYPRDLFPLGDYAVVRTELFDPQEKVAVPPSRHWRWVLSCPSGTSCEGARCWGQMEQDDHTYTMIRHLIIARPIEVRIPFKLNNIPVPKYPVEGGSRPLN